MVAPVQGVTMGGAKGTERSNTGKGSAGDDPRLHAGKLPPHLLSSLLASLPTQDPFLLVGPSVGEDAAVIDFAPDSPLLLVAKSDPVTFATDEIGYYAVNVCANDIAVAGAIPHYFFPTLLLPASSADQTLARRIFAQIGRACRDLGIVVAGGHSEVTASVNQPVVAGAMLGTVPRGRHVRSGGSRPADLVLLAGSVPVEGVSIIARERRDDLLALGFAMEDVETAARYLFDPGISVLAPARAAAEAGLVSAMHDPTEGGVATGLAELAAAAGLGLHVALDAIPVSPLAARLCAAFGLDPLGTIASGALLASCAPENLDALLAVWRDCGWSGTVIGHMLDPGAPMTAERAGKPAPFPEFAADELTRL